MTLKPIQVPEKVKQSPLEKKKRVRRRVKRNTKYFTK